jgi:uncharacterized protein
MDKEQGEDMAPKKNSSTMKKDPVLPSETSASSLSASFSEKVKESPALTEPPSTRLPQDPKLRLPEEEPFDHRKAKFILEPQPQAEAPQTHLPAYENLGELPASYGTRKLYLTARDPHFLYAYWDLTHSQLAEAEQQAHDGKVFLQLYYQNGARLQQIQISPWSKEWYLHVDQADTSFYVEIGIYREDGSFEVMTRSTGITTPRDSVSWKTDLQFVTIPFEFRFRELLEIIRHSMREGEELAAAMARLQSEGFQFPFAVGRRTILSENSQQELQDYMGSADIIRRIQSGSGEIIEIMRKNWQPAQSSGQWISSISSPFGSSFGPQQREFFLHVNAELIIYGGTSPDAQVRINGSDIRLEPDGSFHYHFNFKDGKFHIPIEATSADGAETRAALLSFLRLSATTDGVDRTSQTERPEPLGRVDD